MSKDDNTFSIRYVGLRFNGKRLPLDVLADLPALRDLIVALAKQEFRQKNPDRKRVPQGFDKSIAFVLTDIKDGSAIPEFSLENEVAQQNLPNIGDKMGEIVERSYQNVAKIFDDASHNIYPQALPQDAIRALSKLGSNIQESEKIEFQGTTGADGNVISLDTHRRKNILTRVRETYTIEFESVGMLTGINTTLNTIQVETEEYGLLQLPLDRAFMPAEQFDGNLHTLVEFSLSIALDAHDVLKAVEEVQSVDLVRPYDEDVKRCLQRLQALSTIEKGWLNENRGEQLVHLAGIRATQFIFMRADLADLFRIFPTEDGGISIEFDKDDWSFAIEVAPDGSLEIDGSSESGKLYEVKSFPEFSKEFFEAFDRMTSQVFHDKN